MSERTRHPPEKAIHFVKISAHRVGANEVLVEEMEWEYIFSQDETVNWYRQLHRRQRRREEKNFPTAEKVSPPSTEIILRKIRSRPKVNPPAVSPTFPDRVILKARRLLPPKD
ncbi:hypothetical protein TNCV_921501 [Trichonephila clavipes]|nr:hypothetical protein TNCV_921501 [Trichonephila clavipes]